MHLFRKVAGLFLAISSLPLSDSYLVGIPTVPFTAASPAKNYSLKHLKAIVVDSQHSQSVDNNGLTLLPPTLLSFAETFQADLAAIGIHLPVILGIQASKNSVFLTIASNPNVFKDIAGRPTSEGYELTVSSSGLTVAGASPLGAWWGTRTVLQQALLGKLKITVGQGIDAPGWGERGMMLDVGRHYYPTEFMVEMCSYLSYFKQNVFHLHLSDHVWNPANLFSHDLAMDLYAGFRTASDNPAIAGLPRPQNETYSPSLFTTVQQQCANRGVTIIPELESPGHSIATTDWRPDLALSDQSMLNLSNPKTLPVVQSYWKALLPGFHSKIVHIGADEYDSNFVGEYTSFVNAMNSYIKAISGKTMRIWGTFPPSKALNATNVDKSVSIQHWDIGQDNALFDFLDRGYKVLNSDDYFYLDVKYGDPGGYPPALDVQRVFFGAPGNQPYAPNIFDSSNATNNPPRNNPNVLGQLAVVWNDWGPNASTYNEAYFMVRDGLPALGDKQWGGNLTLAEYESVFPALQAAVPAQNLDRRVPSKKTTILNYEFGDGSWIRDSSGNGYTGQLVGAASISNNILHLSGGYVKTPLTSKGRNYTLSFSVMSTSSNLGGSLFSGPDSSFLNGNGTSPLLMLVSGNIAYPVDLTLPLNKWVDVKVSGIGAQTFIEVAGVSKEVTINMGIWGGGMQLGPMAIEAPLQTIGQGFVGQMKKITLTS